MSKAIFLGAGASPGVPSISMGWGDCNPNNPKNVRRRTSTFYEVNGLKLLIDTSPDLRCQLLDNKLFDIDAVLYTHFHFDHVSGIDELREINRRTLEPLPFYATKPTMNEIKKRYGYMVVKKNEPEFYMFRGGLIPHEIKENKEFNVNGVKIMPLKLLGHNVSSCGFIINDEIVHISDFKEISASAMERILKIKPKLLVMPLTIFEWHKHHVGLKEAMEYVEKICPERVVFNHMATECDYDNVNNNTPDFVEPAYDNLVVEW